MTGRDDSYLNQSWQSDLAVTLEKPMKHAEYSIRIPESVELFRRGTFPEARRRAVVHHGAGLLAAGGESPVQDEDRQIDAGQGFGGPDPQEHLGEDSKPRAFQEADGRPHAGQPKAEADDQPRDGPRRRAKETTTRPKRSGRRSTCSASGPSKTFPSSLGMRWKDRCPLLLCCRFLLLWVLSAAVPLGQGAGEPCPSDPANDFLTVGGRTFASVQGSLIETTVTTWCLSCHDGTVSRNIFRKTLSQGSIGTMSLDFLDRSHPVDIAYPRNVAGFVNIDLLDRRLILEGDRVTCVTCHFGDDGLEVRLQTDGIELCLGCHIK